MQALDNCLKEIKNIPNISTFNEAQARRSVIERILEFLGWVMHNYDEVKLEYGVETRRVDYALQIKGNNEVFIEAKKPGEELENHQEQLLDYSFKEGVALAILTNGITWWFYLPLQKGAWNDRKFHTINILEQKIEDIVDKFDHLLSRENVASGKAVEHAKTILESSQREKIVKEHLPEVWNKVIKKPDSLLVDLLAETAEEVCGFKLESDEILRFVRSHQEKWFLSSVSETPESPDRSSKNPGKKSERWMRIDNEDYEFTFGYEILVMVANWLIDRGALQKSDYPIKTTTRSKRYLINKTPVHTTTNKDFVAPRKLKNGLYIETHHSTKGVIDQAKRLLEQYGYDPEILKIEA